MPSAYLMAISHELRGELCDALVQAEDRKRPDLADLHPGSSREARFGDLHGEGKASSLGLTRDRECDDSSRALVEDIMADNQDGATACLFLPLHGIQVGPVDLASQYSGH